MLGDCCGTVVVTSVVTAAMRAVRTAVIWELPGTIRELLGVIWELPSVIWELLGVI